MPRETAPNVEDIWSYFKTEIIEYIDNENIWIELETVPTDSLILYILIKNPDIRRYRGFMMYGIKLYYGNYIIILKEIICVFVLFY